MKRLTTRSIRTAEAIRDREDFITSGALRGQRVPDGGLGPGIVYRSWLNHDDEAYQRWLTECYSVDYVVWSYATPIAWHTTEGEWYMVPNTFSPTTSKHQSNLYLAKREVDLCAVTGCVAKFVAGPWCESHAVVAGAS